MAAEVAWGCGMVVTVEEIWCFWASERCEEGVTETGRMEGFREERRRVGIYGAALASARCQDPKFGLQDPVSELRILFRILILISETSRWD